MPCARKLPRIPFAAVGTWENFGTRLRACNHAYGIKKPVVSKIKTTGFSLSAMYEQMFFSSGLLLEQMFFYAGLRFTLSGFAPLLAKIYSPAPKCQLNSVMRSATSSRMVSSST